MGVRATLLELFNPVMNASGQLANGGLPMGQVAAAGSTSTSSESVTLAVGNSWIVAGMPVYDVTAGALVGTVGSYTAGSTSLTLAANASHAIANGDVLQFGFTPSDLAAGEAAGRDIRGAIDLAVMKLNEVIALINDLAGDVITSSQDSTANSVLTTAVTNLS